MRVELKDFQTNAVITLYDRLRQMRSAYERDGALSSVCLSSVTGSGKTVMCAAVIEALFFGNDALGLAPDERAAVLWVSDSPSLNDQTHARFVSCSDKLADWPGDTRCLEDVSNTFCAAHEVLDPRHVYFLSKDLLGRGNKLVKGGEENSGRVFWDVLDRTIKDPEINLYLFIDEAHRGFGTNASGGKAEETIYGNLVNGYEDRAPMPMVVGVSATPERFEARMDGMRNRDRKARVSVSPTDVQESGLIKDTIELRVPESDDPVEHQYLTMAAKRFQLCREHWDAYCQAEGEQFVWPLMIVQVKDKQSPESLREMCDQISKIVPGLNEASSFANVFGDHKDLTAGRYLIPYVRPELVQVSPHIQVLFAKEAISNGWDCPRAEVIFSQRNRKDPTYIAQLIGRMVRTPLARRVEADDLLNSIACYLPQFNRDATQGVVDYLTGKTDKMGGTAVAKVTVQPVTVRAAAPRTQEDYEREQAAYERAEAARREAEKREPGYQFEFGDEPENVQAKIDFASTRTIEEPADDNLRRGTAAVIEYGSAVKLTPMAPPKPLTPRDASFTHEEWDGIRKAFESIEVRRNPKKARNEFVSLLRTATLFMDAGIDRDAGRRVNEDFARNLAGALVSCEDEVGPVHADIETTNTKLIRIDKRHGNEVTEYGEEVVVDDEGIAKAAREADTVFGGRELTNAYRKRLLSEGKTRRQMNLDLAAACRTASVVSTLSEWAKTERTNLFDKGSTEYDLLSDKHKQRYRELESETGSKLTTRMQWPETVNVKAAETRWPKHIVQEEDGLCPLDLNDDETYVVSRELERSRTVAFYRNPAESMSPLAFSIPYTSPVGRKAVHPDFIFFIRDAEGAIRPSIIDPHGSYLADAVPKLKGYVEYLREYPDTFIQALSISSLSEGPDRFRSLNLLDPKVQDAIMGFDGDMAEELYRCPLSHKYE
ncbi:DEAD/DEAH box helicase family protein [Enorma sp.]|uniref:DEAD/DEAH box helicase n=1 Tax=Enorma sp. TaxID=1920692 RepID=UPI0025BCA910|nr:DEAD/DEAH box helicase family protein [Enorma sp.]